MDIISLIVKLILIAAFSYVFYTYREKDNKLVLGLSAFIVLITFISHRDNLDLYDRLLITCEESNTIKIKYNKF